MSRRNARASRRVIDDDPGCFDALPDDRVAQGDTLDEVYGTLGARVLATDALSMIAPIPGGSPFAEHPREAQLVSVHRSDDELFLRYRFVENRSMAIGP